ncbi:MAG: D-glycero-beta-D-manno-heptose 1-phosphate adenylyltransferase [Phaeodactylibacter xiamenensis]|uniref:D-glycero-beta-D-manno-heptose 1-phosphate adenylyltransferase n=1 Tax=Phaeodactylibacter xiamenensis TaxID=1524460 RepID=UPI0005C58CB2|nr:D-glycero-beta-D-manno-heptose 1-phosphate adenylyltransferase [Phaeodactylibacter xiamenensis]MCR9050668.1 D-glycero-beta-D-manno-heptose 1-phosphate adenylyltransferase [bacterium]
MIEKIKAKIKDRAGAAQQRDAWQQQGQKVVFTNGCFDLLHYGHIHYLAQARELGDVLIIGLNAADSVRRLKGPNRPINDETTRLWQMAALQFVDMVVPFEEDTPAALIELLKPDVLVKGGDYEISSIVGADTVLQNGGEVRVLPYIEGYSTTSLEAKIRNSP